MSRRSASTKPPANLNPTWQVIEYLLKKGYNRTEQMLRLESSNLDQNGKPVQERAEDLGTAKYSRGFRLLSAWVDQNLDIYKVRESLGSDKQFKVKSHLWLAEARSCNETALPNERANTS